MAWLDLGRAMKASLGPGLYNPAAYQWTHLHALLVSWVPVTVLLLVAPSGFITDNMTTVALRLPDSAVLLYLPSSSTPPAFPKYNAISSRYSNISFETYIVPENFLLMCPQKIPFVGSYFINEIPPEDNVSILGRFFKLQRLIADMSI